MPISEKARAIVDATAPAVAGNIGDIVDVFYSKLLSENPSLKAFFNMSNQNEKRQPTALAHGVLAAVAHLDNLGAIQSALLVMCHKHCALGVEPAQYKVVHDTFLAATAQVLGDAVTEDVAAAWSEVLMLVATAMIEQEEQIYAEAERRPGGWRGLKEFTISKIREEGENVRSIWFTPKDGSAMPEFTPGQYITVCENPSKEELLAPRHYTISSDTEFRITVKRIQHGQGIMSSFLHSLAEGDVVKLRPPFGSSTHESVFPQAAEAADTQTRAPHVFIAGGIGITPIRALAAVSAAQGARMVVLHAHKGGGELQEELQELLASNADSAFVRGDRSVVAEDNLRTIVDTHNIDVERARVFLCAPRDMTDDVLQSLANIGWTQKNIAVHFFGPKGFTDKRPRRRKSEEF